MSLIRGGAAQFFFSFFPSLFFAPFARANSSNLAINYASYKMGCNHVSPRAFFLLFFLFLCRDTNDSCTRVASFSYQMIKGRACVKRQKYVAYLTAIFVDSLCSRIARRAFPNIFSLLRAERDDRACRGNKRITPSPNGKRTRGVNLSMRKFILFYRRVRTDYFRFDYN